MTKETGKLYTVNEIATLVRTDPTTIRRWVKAGLLAAIILPHPNKRQAYRFDQATVDKLLSPSPLAKK